MASFRNRIKNYLGGTTTAAAPVPQKRSVSAQISSLLSSMASKAGESTALSDPYTQSVGIFRAVNVIGQQLSAAPLRVYSNGERVDYNPLQILLDRPIS